MRRVSNVNRRTNRAKGDGRPGADGVIGDILHLDPDRLATLAERGADALVVAVVEGGHEEGMEESVPGWSASAKGLQGQVGEENGALPWNIDSMKE